MRVKLLNLCWIIWIIEYWVLIFSRPRSATQSSTSQMYFGEWIQFQQLVVLVDDIFALFAWDGHLEAGVHGIVEIVKELGLDGTASLTEYFAENSTHAAVDGSIELVAHTLTVRFARIRIDHRHLPVDQFDASL